MMGIFAVFRRRTPLWDDSAPLEAQRDWEPHASYMMDLQAEGFVLMAGPLGDDEGPLIIVRAESAEAIETRLAGDPWTGLGMLETEWIKPWEVRIGAPG